MSRGEYTVTIGADASQALAEFAKLGQAAQRSGGEIGKGLSTGLDTTNANIRALQGQIRTLTQTRAQFKVDSSEFKAAQAQVDQLQSKLQQALGQRLRLQVDASALTAAAAEASKALGEGLSGGAREGAQATLRELNSLKSNIIREFKDLKAQGVSPADDAYKSLQARLAEVNQQIRAIKMTPADLPQAIDGFRLLDGVVQGVAFSLSNAVVDGAGRALAAVGGLISGFAKLDTVIRQAAAASGGPDDYAKLAATISKVGIDASGTSEQVAALSLELARGGMTADQQADSLMGIVRGAEATATAYDRMGQIVSAALTAFGLEAKDTTRVVDALVQGANTSATDVSGLGEAFKTAAPAAKLLGVSIEDLAFAVGSFTNAGITAGEAGTALRNGLAQLAVAAPVAGRPLQGLTGQAKIAAETIQQLGLASIYTADGQLKPMIEVLMQLKKAFSGLTAGKAQDLAQRIFGGFDDGNKWLALLSQSEEKLKASAAQMANSAGATDRNRDAMQNLQKATESLLGTIDNLGKDVGRVAAGALLPMVYAANAVVGAISGLPGPVKDTAIAVTLLTGSVIAATTAYVVFKKVLAIGAISDTIADVARLSLGIGTTLKSAIGAAIAAWPVFIAQVQLASTAQLTMVGALQATAKAIYATLLSAIGAAAKGLGNFVQLLTSAQFATFIGGIRAAVAALAPFAFALGGIVAAYAAWREVLASSDAVQQKFAGSQKEAADAMGALQKALKDTGDELDKTSTKAQDTRNWFEKLLSVPRESMGMREITMQTLKQIEAWEGVSVAINKYLAANQKATNLNGESATQAVAYVKAAQAAADANTKRAASLREYADAAEAAGRLDEAAQARNSADTLDRVATSYRNQAAALQAKLDPMAKEVTLTKEQRQAIDARRAAEEALNNVIAEAPVRKLDQQLAVGQGLLNLAQAIGQAEQSRFGVTRSALEFELQQAEKLGASEVQIGAIKDRIAANDRAALEARYRSLLREQELQRALLALEQQKARAQAQIGILQQQSAIAKASRELEKAKAEFGGGSDQAAQALAELRAQEQILGYKQQELGILEQTQPLQLAALGYQQQAARYGLQGEAAAKGWAFAIDGTLKPANALVELQGRISTVTRATAEEQARYTQLAAESGLAIAQAADGTLVLGRTQDEVNAAVTEMNRQISGAASGYAAAGQSAGTARGETDLLRQSLATAGLQGNALAQGLLNAGNGAGDAKGKVDGIGTSLGNAATPANALATAFIKTGEKAPAIVQGSRDFAGWLSSASRFANSIAGLNLGRQMQVVASETAKAARAAQDFFNSLNQASKLPGSRWTGGPVEAGQSYRINELGQEAFLSAGRLSLINAPANAIWRAPAPGVVIPAGVTARLRERGQLAATPGGSTAGTAELAIEVGKLRREVGNLARKDWNVHVQHRTGPTGSQVMRTLLR